MTTSEPNWPTLNQLEVKYNSQTQNTRATVAVAMCREAFRRWQEIENDDPASDPIGTVRRDTVLGLAVLTAKDFDGFPWLLMDSNPNDSCWAQHVEVKGWKVVGAVPFTPAAETKP